TQARQLPYSCKLTRKTLRSHEHITMGHGFSDSRRQGLCVQKNTNSSLFCAFHEVELSFDMSPVNQEPGHTIQNFVWNLVCAQNVHISGCHIRLLSPSTLLDHDKGELGHGSFLENDMVHV